MHACAKIIISGLRENRLREAIQALSDLGVDAKYKVADATKLEDWEALADFAWDAYGQVDVIINNAGIMVPHSPVLDMPIEHFRAIFEVNFFGVIYGSQVFGKRFIEQGTPAAIYNVGSENSLFHGTPFNGAYVASKHSVFAITKSLREELPEFIDVSLICPGFVFSELGPEENMKHGMPTDEYIEIAMPQIKVNEFYVVSHAYNMVRIDEEYEKRKKAYEKYAPRYKGDSQYDVRSQHACKDLGKANIVTLYLLQDTNQKLKLKLEKELKPGTRVISHVFTFDGWNPQKVDEESEIYMYRIVKKN